MNLYQAILIAHKLKDQPLSVERCGNMSRWYMWEDIDFVQYTKADNEIYASSRWLHRFLRWLRFI